MLPYQYVEEPTTVPVTGYAGLFPYLDLACVLGVLGAVDEKLKVCGEQSWRDRQHVLALVLVNLAGGDCIEDIRLREAEKYGLSRPDRRELQRRFRKGRERAFPSPTRLHEWLDESHDPAQEQLRVEGKAFIPGKNAPLRGLAAVNAALAILRPF